MRPKLQPDAEGPAKKRSIKAKGRDQGAQTLL